MADKESQRPENIPLAKSESQTEKTTEVALPGDQGLDPLVELSDSAKARIRAREAEASEYLELVRKSLQSRLRDLTQYVVVPQIANACHKALSDAQVTAAGHVFLAHATEYVPELPQSSSLAHILAKLRDAVIKRYGEHARVSVEAREAKLIEIEKALGERETASASAKRSREPTIVGDARFWRQRRDDFREYNSGGNARLYAYWSSLYDRWILSGSDEAQRNFKPLAGLAMQGIQHRRPSEPWALWLDELRTAGRHCMESEGSDTLSQEVLEDPVKFGVERPAIPGVLRTGLASAKGMKELAGVDRPRLFAQWDYRTVSVTVESLFGASADLCLDFEARAATGEDQAGAPLRRSPKELVDAAKRQPRRSYEKFAAVIGIGKDTLYAITKETRWVSDDTYGLVAEACKCQPEDLHPRDIPRPERRRG